MIVWFKCKMPDKKHQNQCKSVHANHNDGHFDPAARKQCVLRSISRNAHEFLGSDAGEGQGRRVLGSGKHAQEGLVQSMAGRHFALFFGRVSLFFSISDGQARYFKGLSDALLLHSVLLLLLLLCLQGQDATCRPVCQFVHVDGGEMRGSNQPKS